MTDQDGVPSMRQRWRALPTSERRTVRRQVQAGGPVDPEHERVAAWYADVRSVLLALLTMVALAVLVGAVVVAVSEPAPVVIGLVVVLFLSVYVNVAELVRVRRVRRALAGPTGHGPTRRP